MNRSLSRVVKKSPILGPVKTTLRLCHVGDGQDVLQRLQQTLEEVDRNLEENLGARDFKKVLNVTAAAFRLLKEFSGAAHFFHRAKNEDAMQELEELAYEFGDLRALKKLKSYGVSHRRPSIFSSESALDDFLIKKFIPSLPIGGDQYHGFSIDDRPLKELGDLRTKPRIESLFAQSVRYLEKNECNDIAKLYILSSHSKDRQLAMKIGRDFAKQASKARQRTLELVQEAFPSASIEVLRRGDTLSVRPRRRFILKLLSPKYSPLVLKEILPNTTDLPGFRKTSRESQILSDLNIEGVPHCKEVIEIKGLRFLVLCNLHGETLHGLLSRSLRLKREESHSMVVQMVDIVARLHERGIAHLDICDENILWDGEKISLIGFDRARWLEESKDTWLLPGYSPPYIAPETLSMFRGSLQSDCFQLGILLARLLGDRQPFGPPGVPTPAEGDRETMLLDYGIPCIYSQAKLAKSIDGDLKELLSSLLQKDPRKRMKSRECRERLNSLLL